jgi:hypothetical protein
MKASTGLGTIALDADGVLLDYHAGYARAWERAFGVHPAMRDPEAYWPWDSWDVAQLRGDALVHFKAQFDSDFWSTLPAIDGAQEACTMLREAGFTLLCVSAVDAQFAQHRMENLRQLGFGVAALHATGALLDSGNPKAPCIAQLRPKAFVDDYLPYLQGLPAGIHRALVRRQENGSPNKGLGLLEVDSQHADLLEFARQFCVSHGQSG